MDTNDCDHVLNSMHVTAHINISLQGISCNLERGIQQGAQYPVNVEKQRLDNTPGNIIYGHPF